MPSDPIQLVNSTDYLTASLMVNLTVNTGYVRNFSIRTNSLGTNEFQDGVGVELFMTIKACGAEL